MLRFATLCQRLDEAADRSRKIAAIVGYLKNVGPRDAGWAVSLLTGHRPKRLVPTKTLRSWGAEITGLPEWLFEASCETSGDVAETIALAIPRVDGDTSISLAEGIEQHLQSLISLEPAEQRSRVAELLREFPTDARYAFNKLLTGGFRSPVSRSDFVEAISQFAGLPRAIIAYRLSTNWHAGTSSFESLIDADVTTLQHVRPFAFQSADELAKPLEEMARDGEFLIEPKWDGIRAQWIQRQGEAFLWSRDDELLFESFPELLDDVGLPEGTTLDGQIVARAEGRPLSSIELERRRGRKTQPQKARDEAPAYFVAFDLMEWEGEDIRAEPLAKRRLLLEQLCVNHRFERIILSNQLAESEWNDFTERRTNTTTCDHDGLILKQVDAGYQAGQSSWWAWKRAEQTAMCVLLYVERGQGANAGRYHEFTLGLRDAEDLVPIAKAAPQLSEEEMAAIEEFVKGNTRERFGPVQSVAAELVFELAFRRVESSSRHKSGLRLTEPRLVRWAQGCDPRQIDSLESLRALIPE